MQPTIKFELDLAEARQKARASGWVFYSSRTPWWTTNPADLNQFTAPVPTDPTGAPLFQTEDTIGFFDKAESAAKGIKGHYGAMGIQAFLLAHHGCVVSTEDGLPMALEGWDAYNQLLADKHAKLLKPAPDVPILTEAERAALLSIAGGADVGEYGTAVRLRGLHDRCPWALQITKIRGSYATGAKRPYFGAILTRRGANLLQAQS